MKTTRTSTRSEPETSSKKDVDQNELTEDDDLGPLQAAIYKPKKSSLTKDDSRSGQTGGVAVGGKNFDSDQFQPNVFKSSVTSIWGGDTDVLRLYSTRPSAAQSQQPSVLQNIAPSRPSQQVFSSRIASASISYGPPPRVGFYSTSYVPPNPSVSRDPVVELTTYYNQKMNELTSERDFLKSKYSNSIRSNEDLRLQLEKESKKRKELEDELEGLKKKKFKFSFKAKIEDAE
ncbi:hypothetical protein JCM5350_004345 [Sporobolomyces pararoseus]